MSLKHHAAAAEEGEGAVGGALRFGRDVYKGRCWGAPSPFPQGAVTAVVSGLSPSCRWLQSGATRMRCLSDEGAAGARSFHRTEDPHTFHRSFGCAFVCVRAHGSAARCKVHSRGCTEGRRGAPAASEPVPV